MYMRKLLTCSCVVSVCGSKTCIAISQVSHNVTKKSYEVISHATSMTCTSKVLYTCNKMWYLMCVRPVRVSNTLKTQVKTP